MLLKRLLTALILIPLVLLANFYLSDRAFTIITALIFLLAGWEMAGLVGYTTHKQRAVYLLYLCVAFALLLLIFPVITIVLSLLVWGAMLYFVLHYDRFTSFWASSSVIRTLLSVWLLAASWFGLLFIHLQPTGAYYVLFMLLFIWAADTGAYFAGRLWGKRKLAPQISPGKSLEGVLGGVVASLLVAVFICTLLPYNTWGDKLTLVLLAGVASLASVLGDLTESMLKRRAAVKDSGHLLPGHGGLLDRIDSLLCVSPVLAAGLLVWSVIGML